MKINLLPVFLVFLSLSCGNYLRMDQLKEADVTYSKTIDNQGVTVVSLPSPSSCKASIRYAPDSSYLDHYPMRTVRLNFHFISDKLGQHNFNEQQGKYFVKYIVMAANRKLGANEKMLLPLENEIPALPIRYRYIVEGESAGDDGIYFHRNDSLFFFNKKDRKRKSKQSIFSNRQYETYGKQKGEILNIFILAHPPDSIGRKGYPATADGCGYPKWAKLGGAYQDFLTKRKDNEKGVMRTAMFFSGLLNHEIGHSLGIHHTWASYDGCDDTPKNPNCWNVTKSGPCKTGMSNNVMDYNSLQSAYTPCQLGKIHFNFSKLSSTQRSNLRKDWCRYHPESTIRIKESVVWDHAKDLWGDVIVEEGARLQIQCRVSFPVGARLIVEPGGVLELDGCQLMNACGDEWKGIQVYRKGKTLLSEVVFKAEPQILNTTDNMGTVE